MQAIGTVQFWSNQMIGVDQNDISHLTFKEFNHRNPHARWLSANKDSS